MARRELSRKWAGFVGFYDLKHKVSIKTKDEEATETEQRQELYIQVSSIMRSGETTSFWRRGRYTGSEIGGCMVQWKELYG